MRIASHKEIAQELAGFTSPELISLCLRLARFKKENKELLTYLLFQAGQEDEYIVAVNDLVSECFDSLNSSNNFVNKKKIRKALRLIKRYTRYTNEGFIEASLLLHFCRKLISSGLPLSRGSIFLKLLLQQTAKFRKLVSALHPDLQHDLTRQLQQINAKTPELTL